jgi:hypothetical protein
MDTDSDGSIRESELTTLLGKMKGSSEASLFKALKLDSATMKKLFYES